MRARHTAHSLPAFPVYSSAFLSPHQLVLGGGGGASRSGIKNKLASRGVCVIYLAEFIPCVEALSCRGRADTPPA